MIGKLNGQDATKDKGVLTDIALDFGGLFRRLKSFVNLLGRLTETDGQSIQRHGEFRVAGLGDQVRGVYGFSIHSGIGDAPRMAAGGNLHACARESDRVVDDVSEPLVDAFGEGDDIVVTVELPGVLENEILVRTGGKRLAVKTVGQRRLAKETSLPTPVANDSVRQQRA